MNTRTTTLYDTAVIAIDAFDIDTLNWGDDRVTSFDPTVIEAAQQALVDYSPEERKKLRMSNHCGSLVHADVAERLYKLKATEVDPGLVASLIIEMYRTVTQ